jgi:hypothetical protein
VREAAVWSGDLSATTLTVQMPATVLLVEDHPTLGATAQILLEADAFEVVGEARDGASAVSEAPRLRPPGRAPGRAAARLPTAFG